MSQAISNPRKRAARWLIAGTLLLGAAGAGLVLLTRSDEPAPRQLSRLEREASARFSNPSVSMGSKRIAVANEEHGLQIKVRAYQRVLADEAEKTDPTFHLKAEAELERRHPVQVAVEWNDVTGNREMDFTVEDSSACNLTDKLELSFAADEVTKYPCLAQGGQFWDHGTKLSVHITPVGREDRLWAELLSSTKRALATEAHLASAEPDQGS